MRQAYVQSLSFGMGRGVFILNTTPYLGTTLLSHFVLHIFILDMQPGLVAVRWPSMSYSLRQRLCQWLIKRNRVQSTTLVALWEQEISCTTR